MTRYLASGEWEPRDTIATLASAMDVGNPSNMERLRSLIGDANALRDHVAAWSIDDPSIEDSTRWMHQRTGMAICPHTATAIGAWRQMGRSDERWIAVATAHPAKFETIVEPLIGRDVEVPSTLQGLLERPSRAADMKPNDDAFHAALLAAFSE